MTKRIFKVTIQLNDGSKFLYNVQAQDDVLARRFAERDLRKHWKGAGELFPGIAFAEIQWVCDLLQTQRCST